MTHVCETTRLARIRLFHRPVTRTIATWAAMFLLFVAFAMSAATVRAETWGERLGYPADRRVLILHADDVGMCYEANQAVKDYFDADAIQSAALMAPCPWFNEMADWYKQHPEQDIGLHLAMNSEWKHYRWGPVAPADQVPGMVDEDGYLWRSVQQTAFKATAAEIETEIRAQIERAKSLGIEPSHIDTHMGTLYARPDYTAAYLKVAEEYRIPAMVVEWSDASEEALRKRGLPLSQALIDLINGYSLPKLDFFDAAPNGDSYEDKRQKFFDLVRSLPMGITEIIFHPSVKTEGLRHITNSWQQRVWEAQMFTDPEVKQFFEREGILFTNWKEMMRRFDAQEAAGKD